MNSTVAMLYGRQPFIYAVGFRYKSECGGQLRVLYVEADSADDAKRKIETLTGPPGTPWTAHDVEVFAVMSMHVDDFLRWK